MVPIANFAPREAPQADVLAGQTVGLSACPTYSVKQSSSSQQPAYFTCSWAGIQPVLARSLEEAMQALAESLAQGSPTSSYPRCVEHVAAAIWQHFLDRHLFFPAPIFQLKILSTIWWTRTSKKLCHCLDLSSRCFFRFLPW